ncbi:LCP family protein [Aciduricibacillus chroicocephali]|uniref:LCP family protein n=1 Tax=Aciduricibacillus chroicocephali TaxID=3054939 RepID=A0ABY9KTJ7_9BACI|nr:LCP family protein [Bacillaceae bacterium 44XB]
MEYPPRSSNTRMVQRRRKKKVRKVRKRIVFILIPLLLLFLGGVGYAAVLYTKTGNMFAGAFKNDGRDKSSLRDVAVNPKFDNVSILIMGVDSSNVRNNADHARTDSLMVATLNKDRKSVKLVSIPRDSYVYIPGVGYSTKINHAHAFGGTKGTIETVEKLLDIPIDYYVKVNFEAFIDVVDALDGVTVDVPFEFKEQDSKDKAGAIHLYPGKQKLDGEEALALARTRKIDNDIERGKRQQQIIKAIISKASSISSVTKYDDIIGAVGKNMTTNLTFDDIKSLIAYGATGKPDIETLSLKGRDYMPGDTYYYQLDGVALTTLKHKLQRHLDVPIKDDGDAVTETYDPVTNETNNVQQQQATPAQSGQNGQYNNGQTTNYNSTNGYNEQGGTGNGSINGQ